MPERRNYSAKKEKGLNMSEWRIPLSEPDYGAEEQAAVARIVQSKWLSMGPEVQAFEAELAEFLGARHAFAVSSGTAALHLCYLALGLRHGDEIIQPAINFVAAANMTLAVGATPVFADLISLDEPTLSPTDLEARITPRTRAVVVMHYGGYPGRMAEIQDICRRRHLALVEDACHSIGARYLDAQQRTPHGTMTGCIGDIASLSFFSNKNLATGEGGMVLTNRDDLADRVRLLRSHGMTTLTWDRHKGHASSYDVVLNGFNYRFNELGAALGRAQLQKLPTNNHRRKELVFAYRQRLSALSGWTVPFLAYPGDSAYHLMVVVAPTEEVRLKTVQRLGDAGIQTSRHYPCLPTLSALKPYHREGLDKSMSFAQRLITLPLYPMMTHAQIEEISALIVAI